VSQNVVAIGKRLSSRVLVTYEQGLRGVWNLLRIQYEITDRLSVRAQTGTDTALDLLYSFSFD
jgi:translocation and assembly module TamB